MFNITGTLKMKTPEQKVSEKFRKRDFVLTDSASQYPQFISFQLVQDRCTLLDAFEEGQEIRVFFNLRGREWKAPSGETKFFNTLEAWKLELVSAQQPATAGTVMNTATPDVTTFTAGESEDDLPF